MTPRLWPGEFGEMIMRLRLPQSVVQLFFWFEEAGAALWLVGGCLRDLSLGRAPVDWDFSTNLPPEDTAGLCQSLGCQTYMTGLKHGTVTVVYRNEAFEITTFRKDGPYGDHRRPDYVQFSQDITDDLSRRDFTVNSMAYSPSRGWLDPFGGLNDLNDRVIRAVGDPQKRFAEDALRILRGIRFSSQFGFRVDPETMAAMRRLGPDLERISRERVQYELNRILLSDQPGSGFRLLASLGLLQWTVPEFMPCVGFDQKSRHHHLDVFEHSLCVTESCPADLITRLAALFHDIGKPACFSEDKDGRGHFYGHERLGASMSEQIMKRLKYDRTTVQAVRLIVLHHMAHLSAPGEVRVKKLLALLGENNIRRLFRMQRADLQASRPPHDFSSIERLEAWADRIIAGHEPLTLKDLAVDGHDLIEWHVAPRERSKVLNCLLEAVYENPRLNSREQLRPLAMAMLVPQEPNAVKDGRQDAAPTDASFTVPVGRPTAARDRP
ncbi:MAG: CCA tRNA nucleotidyltransferase, partial [Peptococcaceae bacterium]|nr:CCA tRNA nucleotidyltransferase [Peptococcaceae bacterium]